MELLTYIGVLVVLILSAIWILFQTIKYIGYTLIFSPWLAGPWIRRESSESASVEPRSNNRPI